MVDEQAAYDDGPSQQTRYDALKPPPPRLLDVGIGLVESKEPRERVQQRLVSMLVHRREHTGMGVEHEVAEYC